MTSIENLRSNQSEFDNNLNIRSLGVETDPQSGIRTHYLEIEDLDEAPNLEARMFIQGVIDHQDLVLQENPEWLAPSFDRKTKEIVLQNEVSKSLYGEDNPALLEWARSMMTAKALYPLQRPYSTHLPGVTKDNEPLLNGVEIDANSRQFLLHGLDAIGIRTRAVVMADLVKKYYRADEQNRWVSLACGAAVPVLDSLKCVGDNKNVSLDLIDIDQDALNFADRLASEQGLEKNQHYTLHQSNLVKELIISDRLVDSMGEKSAQIVDMMGIFEYFEHPQAVKMMKNAYRLVDDGGVLIAANMLSSRPQLAFNQRGVGWPGIHPRSTEELAAIVEDAGIDKENVDIYIPTDGIYAIIELRK